MSNIILSNWSFNVSLIIFYVDLPVVTVRRSHGINYEALVVFDEDPHAADWKAIDIPFFAMLALMGGVLSVMYSEVS